MGLHLKTKPYLSKYRSISGISVLVRLMEKEGISVEKLLSGSSIRVDDLDDPDILVSPEQELGIIRRVTELSTNPEIGLVAGHHGHVGVNGKLGMAWICCDTFLEVVQMAIRYIDLTLTFFKHELTLQNNHVCHILAEIVELKELQYFITEREFASIARMLTDVLGRPFKPKEVHFAYPEPEYGASYQDYFHCPVYFEAQCYMFIYDKKYLYYQLPKSDPLMKKNYEKECKQLIQKYRNRKTTEDIVRQELTFSDNGYLDIDKLARRLNMSSRTLRRKLTTEGTSYQNILDDIRKRKARDLLTETNKSNEEIAAIIGYSDTANFYHAFKRWTGQAPGNYRASHKTSNP